MTSRSGAAAPATCTCSRTTSTPTATWSGSCRGRLGRASRSSRCSGFGFRVTVLADAPEQSQFTLHDLRRAQRARDRQRRGRRQRRQHAVDQPPVARPDIVEVRPGQHDVHVRVLVNDYDPEGGALRVVNVSPVPGADLRIGPGGQEIFVSVNPGVASSFSFGYDVADEAGNQSGTSRAGAPRARRRGEPSTGRPARRRPHGGRTRRRHPGARQRLRPRR